MPDGRPQVNPVWVDLDAHDRVLVNTARGRQKDRNLTERPQATVLLIDPENPYRYLEVRGDIVDVTEDGGRQLIDLMAKKYLGQDEYPFYGGETRVLYVIGPTRVTSNG
jgi:PPOX class probable F420-dependent enzyme